MALISKKKPSLPILAPLFEYLEDQGRAATLPLAYEDLLGFHQSFPLLDANREDTLWETVLFDPLVQADIERALTAMYVILLAGGEHSVMDHLYVERVDYCTFGNTQPFRIRVVNRLNDNYDYFYVKRIDASRVVGLELEHLLSPNRINFIIHQTTLLEEHIIGIPGDRFIRDRLTDPTVNKIRLAKEFVKFNERCFARLLGDMRSYNYVVDLIEDFDGQQYRIRSIDFDQQSYFGSRDTYFPQKFPENETVVDFCRQTMSPALIKQYQVEERTLLARRLKSSQRTLGRLLDCVESNQCAPQEHVMQLRSELNRHYGTNDFGNCLNMGAILRKNLQMLMAGQGLDPKILD